MVVTMKPDAGQSDIENLVATIKRRYAIIEACKRIQGIL